MATQIEGGSRSRVIELDTLRAVLVAWIIGGHALLGYSAIGGWAYDEINEVTFSPVVEYGLAALLGPTALFLMGTFFLVSGLFVPRALAGKGPRRFVRERTWQLGGAALVSMLVLWPLTLWIAYLAAGERVSYGFLLTGRDRKLDSGALWFAEVLLLFSLGYVVVKLLVANRQRRGPARPLTGTSLMALAVGIAVTTFLVRLWFPARATQYGDLHVWQWPMLGAMFCLGIAGASRGLAEHIPDRLRRDSGLITLSTVLSLPVIAVAAGVTNLSAEADRFLGGLRWESMLLATFEGVLVVFGSIWLLGFAHRWLTGGGRIRHIAIRSSFAAFVLQGPVLILLATALRPLPAPAEFKAPVVCVLGILACFGLGWLLVSRSERRRRRAEHPA